MRFLGFSIQVWILVLAAASLVAFSFYFRKKPLTIVAVAVSVFAVLAVGMQVGTWTERGYVGSYPDEVSVDFSLPGKPPNMDQVTYDLALEAVEVGEGYLSMRTSATDACDRLNLIYNQLDAYAPINSTSHSVVETRVLVMAIQLSGIDGGPDREEVEESLAALKDAIR